MTSSSGREPDFASALATLRHLSTSELQELLQNEDRVLQRVRNLDQMRDLYGEKEVLMASNKSLAEYNLSLEPRLSEARDGLRARQSELASVMQRLRVLVEENDNTSVVANKQRRERKGYSDDPDTLVAILQAAHSELEEQSDKLADSFVHNEHEQEGAENVELFLSQFIAKRRLVHLRRIKIDKLKELLNSNNRVARPQPSRAAPPIPGAAVYNTPLMASSNVGPNLPYPLHPTGMPSGPSF